MAEKLIRCECGGAVLYHRTVRFGFHGRCEKCDRVWVDDNYSTALTCYSCGRMFRPEDETDLYYCSLACYEREETSDHA